MIRSLLGVVDLARDAVGAYVGVLREHVKSEWATVLGGSFDERVATARARMEAQADVLAEKEADEEVSEPQACPDCDGVWLNGVGECPESSPAAAQRAGEPPEVEPSPTAPSGGIKPEWPLSHYELRVLAMGIEKLMPHELDCNRRYWSLLAARLERLADEMVLTK